MKNSAILVMVALNSVPRMVLASGQKTETLTQHQYVNGESLAYFFEDTDNTFEASVEDGALQPTTLQQVQELQISFTISIKTEPGGKLHRVLRFQNDVYRGGDPVGFSKTSLRALPRIIPKFPANFSYEYQNDRQAISKTAEAYAPYMGDSIGSFVYYKALDIHTIQSVIDNIPGTRSNRGSLSKNPPLI